MDILGPGLADFRLRGRLTRYRYQVAASHHLSRMFAKWFPRAFPTIYVAGYPRSGTTWLCRLIADYFRLPHPQIWLLPLGGPAVTHTHTIISRRTKHAVYIARDGRDTTVSLYHMHVRNMADRPTRAQRRGFWLPLETRADIQGYLPAFIRYIMTRPHGSHYNWSDHVTLSLARCGTQVPIIRYEDLMREPEETLAGALQTLSGVPPIGELVRETLDRNSFAKLSGRRPGEGDDRNTVRKGMVGDWVNCFNREAAQIFDEFAGETLIRLGYETDHSWVDKCPE